MLKLRSKYTGAYIRDSVFAANDGIITTFAVIAGSQGANIAATVVIILGISNLIADGLSMASGNYQGIKSEAAYNHRRWFNHIEKNILWHPTVTFISFVIAGLIPLVPYVFDLDYSFELSLFFVVLALFAIGLVRGHFNEEKNYVKSGFESLLIGGTAAIAAYLIGFWLKRYIV